MACNTSRHKFLQSFTARDARCLVFKLLPVVGLQGLDELPLDELHQVALGVARLEICDAPPAMCNSPSPILLHLDLGHYGARSPWHIPPRV